MADSHHTGVVATLHRLTPGGLERIEEDLREFSASMPIGLVLPALYLEFETPAMQHIIRELAGVSYVNQVAVALGRASFVEYEHARSFFEGFPLPVTFLWIDSNGIQELLRLLEEHGLSADQDGKGRSCWLAYGYDVGLDPIDVNVERMIGAFCRSPTT
jgi:glucosyl-3-phosphoglycerate synthase